jgi:hypothetical protein
VKLPIGNAPSVKVTWVLLGAGLELLMIALLIGGTVVLCVGLLTVVYGVPIKEFSFGNTMIIAGTVGACTGLILIGLYWVGREIRNLGRRLETGIGAPAPAATSRDLDSEAAVAAAIAPPTRSVMPESPKPLRSAPARPHREDTLFTRDQPYDRQTDHDDDVADERSDHKFTRSATLSDSEETSTSWRDRPNSRDLPLPPEPLAPQPAERPRRNIMFSSTRRESPTHERTPIDLPPADHAEDQGTVGDDFQHRAPGPETDNAFDQAWPGIDKPTRQESGFSRGRADSKPADDDVNRESSESSYERFQAPRRADASSVTIVKSGVVDSMAYSLYSDGSIEAQMPEGMVRFVSIDELRAHLDQRT